MSIIFWDAGLEFKYSECRLQKRERLEMAKKGSNRLIEEILLTHGRIVAARRGVLGDERITGPQSIVLTAIAAAETAPTVSKIARSLGYSRQAIQRIADQLIELNYVCTQPNPDHARAKLLVLTEYGDNLYRSARQQREDWVNSLVRDISAEDLAHAAATIRRLRKTIEEDLRIWPKGTGQP